jgi:DNA-nicking Smr family endonuclease
MRRRNRRELSAEEHSAWALLAQGVTPLDDRPLPYLPPEPPLPDVDHPIVPDAPRLKAPPPPLGSLAGLDRRKAERLKRGELVIDWKLDLHGMTQEAARNRMLALLDRAWTEGWRCLLVVTGKGARGGGVIRTNLPRWLDEADHRPRILALQRAAPHHGGDGAYYVLLRRQREG